MNRPKAGLQHSTELGEGSWEEREGQEEKTHKYSVVEKERQRDRDSREKKLKRVKNHWSFRFLENS